MPACIRKLKAGVKMSGCINQSCHKPMIRNRSRTFRHRGESAATIDRKGDPALGRFCVHESEGGRIQKKLREEHL